MQLAERRAGNAAYAAGRYAEALTAYNRALAVVDFVRVRLEGRGRLALPASELAGAGEHPPAFSVPVVIKPILLKARLCRQALGERHGWAADGARP